MGGLGPAQNPMFQQMNVVVADHLGFQAGQFFMAKMEQEMGAAVQACRSKQVRSTACESAAPLANPPPRSRILPGQSWQTARRQLLASEYILSARLSGVAGGGLVGIQELMSTLQMAQQSGRAIDMVLALDGLLNASEAIG